MTNRKAPESVMSALCEAVLDLAPCALPAHLDQYVKAYRAATAPLRTRASVDAEIGRIMRDAYSAGPGAVSFSAFTSLHLSRLCSEPTADEPEKDEKGDPVPTLYTDCGKCRYPTAGKTCADEWCNRRGCCGHDKSKGRL